MPYHRNLATTCAARCIALAVCLAIVLGGFLVPQSSVAAHGQPAWAGSPAIVTLSSHCDHRAPGTPAPQHDHRSCDSCLNCFAATPAAGSDGGTARMALPAFILPAMAPPAGRSIVPPSPPPKPVATA